MLAHLQKCTQTHMESKEFLQAWPAHKSTGSPDMKTSIFGIFPFHLCLPLMRSLPPSSFQSASDIPARCLLCYEWMNSKASENHSILFKMRGAILQCHDTVTLFSCHFLHYHHESECSSSCFKPFFYYPFLKGEK